MRVRGGCHGVIACVLLVAMTSTAAAAPVDCTRAVLEDLGWRFEQAESSQPVIQPGQPCERADLAQAQAFGDLRVQLPASMDAAAREALYARLLAAPATTCAFGFRLGDATRRAVDALAANPGYRFSWLQVGWIGFGPTGSARDGWRPIATFGRGYVPRAGNWEAIQGFRHGQVRAECGVGRQVAQLAAQAELFGREGFDRAFSAEELVIGTWSVLNASDSILQGSAAGEMTHDGQARTASALGRQAFMGVPGYIEHVYPRRYLDDIHNQAQNFVVYDIDEAAVAALRRRDGFAGTNAMALDLWRLSRQLPRQGRRYFERLLVQREPALRASVAAMQPVALAQLDAIIADPVFSGLRIYVHRHGVTPMGYHFVRLLDRNPRTPFQVAFALHNVHTTLMQRWIDQRARMCAAPMP